MDDKDLTHKSDQAGYQNQHTLPTLEQWRKFESNRLLMEPRKKFMSVAFRVIAIAALSFHVPLLLVAAWAAVLFIVDLWMRHLTVVYQDTLNTEPSPRIMTVPLEKIVRNYKIAWVANCFAWCGLSLLSQIWLPIHMRLLCIGILNALMFISITRSYVDRRMMHQVSAALILTQFLFVGIRFVFKGHDPEVVTQVSIYTLYLLLMSYLLWSVGNRFNRIHVLRLDSDYSKLLLIDSLTKSQAQLHLEQQALTASNKLVQQFYSGAAHDLRQPVYAMQLYTTMLTDDPSLSKTLLPKITQSCVAINDMFNTLFDYQQTHMNDTELVEKEICIQECFNSLALHFQPIASGKGLQIRFKPMPGSVKMVPLYITRILSNLITNALRYTDKGCVLVVARKKRNHISFEVWDTGIGIEASALEKIFKEFYQVTQVDINKGGLGLGLSIANQLSARIDGAEITVKSRVGRGSVFKFLVPLSRYILNNGKP